MNQSSTTTQPFGIFSTGSPLRKLLRCKRTKAFLAQDGTWTHDLHKALTISEPTVPPELRALAKAEEFEIYYSFDDSRESQYDFTLSVR